MEKVGIRGENWESVLLILRANFKRVERKLSEKKISYSLSEKWKKNVRESKKKVKKRTKDREWEWARSEKLECDKKRKQ